MIISLYMIAPNTKRELTSTLADLEKCTQVEGVTPLTAEQEQLLAYFNDDEDIQQAFDMLKLGGDYAGYDDSGEYRVGISGTSMAAAKLIALEQFVKDLDDEDDTGAFDK